MVNLSHKPNKGGDIISTLQNRKLSSESPLHSGGARCLALNVSMSQAKIQEMGTEGKSVCVRVCGVRSHARVHLIHTRLYFLLDGDKRFKSLRNRGATRCKGLRSLNHCVEENLPLTGTSAGLKHWIWGLTFFQSTGVTLIKIPPVLD